jgi:hypothetical protein
VSRNVLRAITARQTIERLERTVAELQAAAEAGEIDRLPALDHELRCAAMAVIGTVPAGELPEEGQMDSLKEALRIVGETLDTLALQQKAQKARDHKANRLRLAYSRKD